MYDSREYTLHGKQIFYGQNSCDTWKHVTSLFIRNSLLDLTSSLVHTYRPFEISLAVHREGHFFTSNAVSKPFTYLLKNNWNELHNSLSSYHGVAYTVM